MICFNVPDLVAERSTKLYTATLKDETQTPIQLVDVVSIKLTLYNVDTALTIVNARDHVDIKNANGGTFHATSGLLSFLFTPLDTAILTDGNSAEIRKALIEVVYSGTKELPHEVQFTVSNLQRRPVVP